MKSSIAVIYWNLNGGEVGLVSYRDSTDTSSSSTRKYGTYNYTRSAVRFFKSFEGSNEILNYTKPPYIISLTAHRIQRLTLNMSFSQIWVSMFSIILISKQRSGWERNVGSTSVSFRNSLLSVLIYSKLSELFWVQFVIGSELYF